MRDALQGRGTHGDRGLYLFSRPLTGRRSVESAGRPRRIGGSRPSWIPGSSPIAHRSSLRGSVAPWPWLRGYGARPPTPGVSLQRRDGEPATVLDQQHAGALPERLDGLP